MAEFLDANISRELRKAPGQAWARGLLKLMGWRLEYDGLPVTVNPDTGQRFSRGVIVAYPHTSNWDGLVGLLTIWALGLDITLWGKASLFKVPVLGWLLKSAGTVPVDRTDARGTVGQTVAAMQQAEHFWLALSPEGTRKRLPGWRTGFYHVATAANVPVALAFLDWGKKRIGISHFLTLSGNMPADFARMREAYAGVVGCVPENASPIEPLDAQYSRKNAVVT
jgi:1-acyl-sn-glycerol-3-phosphate acyltransferase